MKNLEELISNLPQNGINRKIDELGRVVVPYDYRKDLYEGVSEVYIQQYKEYVIISKTKDDIFKIGKQIDQLGRIIVNYEIRKELGWNEKDLISIWLVDGYILLKKKQDSCIFCGKEEKELEFKDRFICKKCKKELQKILNV